MFHDNYYICKLEFLTWLGQLICVPHLSYCATLSPNYAIAAPGGLIFALGPLSRYQVAGTPKGCVSVIVLVRGAACRI